jgi:ATP-dependent RNA helicase DDX18/HAS1
MQWRTAGLGLVSTMIAASVSSMLCTIRSGMFRLGKIRMMTDIAERSTFFSKKSLESIGLNSKMVNVLSSLQINRPSKIQALTFSSIFNGKHCIIGDQTGSGKTLAYLLPVIQRMDEKYANGTLSRPKERSPYVVVMTPTTELAS